MHWFGGASYITAATISLWSGHHPMLAFVAIMLMSWLAVVVVIESRTAVEIQPVETNGWTAARSTQVVATISAIMQLAFVASLIKLSLIFFSVLLTSWTLLL